MMECEAVYLCLDALHDKAYRHPEFHSHHEAYGVLLEEVDEYFEHVRERRPSMSGCRRSWQTLRRYALRHLLNFARTDMLGMYILFFLLGVVGGLGAAVIMALRSGGNDE